MSKMEVDRLSFGGKVADDTYMEWVAIYQTSLKANRSAASGQPASDLWVVPSKGIVRGKLLEDDAEYWKVGDATINGAPVPAHINLAYKAHWTRPVKIVPANIEDHVQVAEDPVPQAVYEDPPQEAAVPEPALADPQTDKAVEPGPTLWQRLFRRRS